MSERKDPLACPLCRAYDQKGVGLVPQCRDDWERYKRGEIGIEEFFDRCESKVGGKRFERSLRRPLEK